MLRKLGPGCSYGKVLKSFDASGFIMSEVAYSARSGLSEHSHENAHFCFVLQGSYTEYHRKQEVVCEPFTLTFRPSGEIHEDRFHKPLVRVFTVEVPPRWMERLQQDAVHLSHSVNFTGGPVTRLSERLVREFRSMGTAAELIIEGLTLELLAEAARHSARSAEGTVPAWLRRTEELLRARFAENLTLEQIASEVGVHPVHLACAFRRRYRHTVGEYVRELRIEYACREIAKGETPLSIIALEAGFANQGHFSSTFKRLTGLTPSAYRNTSRRP